MNLDREKNQGGLDVAVTRIKFCLDQLEKSNGFSGGFDWDTDIVPRCTLEIIGALVSAEQCLNNGSES